MTHDPEPSPPSDVCLLLRAHAEQRWLSLEVGPVLRQLRAARRAPRGAARRRARLPRGPLDRGRPARRRDRRRLRRARGLRARREADAACAQPDARASGGWTLPRRPAATTRPCGPCATCSAARSPRCSPRQAPRASTQAPEHAARTASAPIRCPRDGAPLRPAVPLHPLRRRARGRRGRRARRATPGVELLALTDHDTVSGVAEALARGRAPRRARRPRGRDLRGRRRTRQTPRELHILGYGIDHTGPALTRAARRVPRRPRAAHAAHGRARCASSASSSTKREIERRIAAGKPIGRPHLAEAVLARARQRRAAARTSRSTTSAR